MTPQRSAGDDYAKAVASNSVSEGSDGLPYCWPLWAMTRSMEATDAVTRLARICLGGDSGHDLLITENVAWVGVLARLPSSAKWNDGRRDNREMLGAGVHQGHRSWLRTAGSWTLMSDYGIGRGLGQRAIALDEQCVERIPIRLASDDVIDGGLGRAGLWRMAQQVEQTGK
jgi:hypothetical protein